VAFNFPKTIERDYQRYILALVKTIRRLYLEALKEWAPFNLDQRADAPANPARMAAMVRTAFWGTVDLDAMFQKVIGVYDRSQKYVDNNLARTYLRAAGVRPVLSQIPKARAQVFAKRNADLIVTLLEDQIARIEAATFEAVAAGARPEQLAKTIRKETGTSEWHARFLARDQTAKLVSNANEQRQRELGATRYIWRTVQDERVRDSHAALEGSIQHWSDPPEPGHPGEDYNCRCTAEPWLGDVLEALKINPDESLPR